MKNRRIVILIIIILLAIVSIYFFWSISQPEISKEEAIDIVIEEIAEPSESEYGLRAYLYPELLNKGSKIQPFDIWVEGEKDFYTCEQDCWFFWFDDVPTAHFSHKTRFVFVNANNGNFTVKEAERWPVVNGKEMWGTAKERESDEFLIFETPTLKIDMGGIEPLELKPVSIHAAPGCEVWAVIVCGYDDIDDTFDEDVQGIYTVLTGLGYADDHIFYVSPLTGDPGVDRVTNIANVQWAINQVATNSDSEDKVFFFYTSHGGIDSLDCNPGAAGGGSISSTDLDNWLDAITCRDMVILIEACHSGSFIGAYWDGTVIASENELTGDGETNRIVITATDTTYSSYPDKDPPIDPNPGDTGSEFPGGYIEAFSTPAADVDGNGAISVGEAYQYAWDNDAARLSGWSFPQMDPTLLTPSDIFHPCTGVDVWISDGPNDIGYNSYDYDSADIWSSTSSTGTVHENPISGQTNYVHVVVHNLGNLPVTNVEVKLYWADTSAALAWPADFNQIGTSYTIASLSAGGIDEHVWSWYVDPLIGLGHDFCFVATADCTADPITGAPAGITYVAPFDNNIAQKNVEIVEGHPGHTAKVWFFIENNLNKTIPFDLVINTGDFPSGQLILNLPEDLMSILLEQSNLTDNVEFVDVEGQEIPSILISGKTKATIRQIMLKPFERRNVTLQIVISETAELGEEYSFRIEEISDDEVIGAINYIIRIVSPE